MGRAVILLLCLLTTTRVHAAGYSPPPGAPRVVVFNHGVEVGVWAAQTAIGHGIGIFERSVNGTEWKLCGQCLAAVESPTLDTAVNAAGGPGPYVASIVERVNQILALRYPAVAPEPTGTTLDKVNGALTQYVIRMVNGSPMVGPR